MKIGNALMISATAMKLTRHHPDAPPLGVNTT